VTNLFSRILSWLVTLLVPVALVMAAVRILISPAYLVFEYNTPAFPADPFGFTKEDRLHWSKIAVQYLLNSADISFLGDLRFPAGQEAPPVSCFYMSDCTRLFNERELKHMLDVKNLVQAALKIWYGSLILLAGLGLWAWFGKWFADYRRGLRRGGWLTVVLLVAIVLFVIISFGVIFVWFHEIFFTAGSWTFYFSDTLIRLFPERFWRDTFLAVGLLAGGAGLALGLLLREKKKDQALS
jgi:integral membrane protein (TIGR01906 family)